MAEPRRPACLKLRHFAPEVILSVVLWHLRFSLSCREVQELLAGWVLALDQGQVLCASDA